MAECSLVNKAVELTTRLKLHTCILQDFKTNILRLLLKWYHSILISGNVMLLMTLDASWCLYLYIYITSQYENVIWLWNIAKWLEYSLTSTTLKILHYKPNWRIWVVLPSPPKADAFTVENGFLRWQFQEQNLRNSRINAEEKLLIWSWYSVAWNVPILTGLGN